MWGSTGPPVGPTCLPHKKSLFSVVSRGNPAGSLQVENTFSVPKLFSGLVSTSWFVKLRLVTRHYFLPDPLITLTSPPPKSQYKRQVKTAIRAHWHAVFLAGASQRTSLRYLRPAFFSLGCSPHPIWWTCGSSPSAVRAATVQAKMLSGRYRSCWLRPNWTEESGACRLPCCGMVPGDTAHIQSGECPALLPALSQTINHLQDMFSSCQHLLLPLLAALNGDRECITTFILDPSTDPLVISLRQEQGSAILQPLFRASRAWVWAAHRTRMRLLGLEEFLM